MARRCDTIHPGERGAELTVAGESEIQRQACEILRLRQPMQRKRQSQLSLISIQRHTFAAAECLRQMHGRSTDVPRNLTQRPATLRLTVQGLFGAIDQSTRGPRASLSLPRLARNLMHDIQRQLLREQRIIRCVAQSRELQLQLGRDASLCFGEAHCAGARRYSFLADLHQHVVGDLQGQAGIPVIRQMIDPVLFGRIEEQRLIDVGMRATRTDTADETATVRNDDVADRIAFSPAAVPTTTGKALHVADADQRAIEQGS